MRLSKKILACVLAALMAISMMPFTAFAASDVQSESTVASIKANDVTTYYDSFAEALAAAPENAGSTVTTITLYKNVTVDSTINITNGKNVKVVGAAGASYSFTSANVDPMFYIDGGSIEFSTRIATIESTTNDCTVFRVKGAKDAAAQYSSLIIGSSTTVKGKEYGILIPHNNHYADGVYVKVTGKMETGLACIYTNGNINQYGANPATILVNGSASKLTCTDNKDNSYHDNAAVYAAGYAVWTFSAGSVTGPTALYAKCGTFDCRGTSFSGTGDAVAYSHNGNGITATGEAIVLENCAGYSEDLNFSITKGTVTSANADPIGSYAYSTGTDTREAETGFVGVSSTGVGPTCKSKGTAADVSEFYNDDLAAKFASGNAYVENSELGGTDGCIRGEAPGAKVVRGDTVLYAGNVISAANYCQPGETVYALKDYSTGGQVRITNQDVTIDLQGYTFTNTNSLYPVRVMDDASATFTNGTVTSAKGLTVETDSKLVIDEDCTVNANIDNYNLSGVQNSTVEIYGTVNGSVTTSKTGSVVNVYEGAEINNASGTAINAKAGTTVNVYGGEVNGTVTETGTGEVNISGGTFNTDVTAYVIDGSTQDSTTGEVNPDAVDTMSITVEDNIDINIYLDDSTASEDYNKIKTIEYTYNKTPDLEQYTPETVNVPATRNADGKVVLNIELAPGQIRDEIRIVAYSDVEQVRDFTTSIAEYCDTIIAGNYPTKLKDLAKSTLDYGKGASRYFGYNTEAYNNYSIQLDDPTTQINAIAQAAANNTLGANIPFAIKGVSYRATSKPEIRFYIDPETTSEDLLEGYNKTVVSTIGTAYFAKHDDDYLLIVKDIDITDFNKQFTVTIKDSFDPLYDVDVVSFTPITWVNAAIASEDENLAFLARTIGNYYLKSVNYFGA